MSTSVIPSTITPSAFASARFGTGKVTFPVSGLNAHAQFEHVKGVPAEESSSGLSVNRLFIINSLIGRYASVTGESAATARDNSRAVSYNEIVREAERLHHAIAHSAYGQAYGSGTYETGSVFEVAG